LTYFVLARRHPLFRKSSLHAPATGEVPSRPV
jgi:hypothetical protein